VTEGSRRRTAASSSPPSLTRSEAAVAMVSCTKVRRWRRPTRPEQPWRSGQEGRSKGPSMPPQAERGLCRRSGELELVLQAPLLLHLLLLVNARRYILLASPSSSPSLLSLSPISLPICLSSRQRRLRCGAREEIDLCWCVPYFKATGSIWPPETTF
jgi:hypothetical protein